MPVQFGFQPSVYTLVDEKERVVLRFGQRVWYDDIFHILKIQQLQMYDNYLKLSGKQDAIMRATFAIEKTNMSD